MKNWGLKQLTEITAYIGVALMIASILHVAYFWFFIAGAALLAIDDDKFKNYMGILTPKIKRLFGWQ